MQKSGIKAPFAHRFPAVGQCIYCGTTGVRLTDEHIVPEGMGGTLILQEASCDPCAKITSLFERRVMQGFMDHGRQALGIKGKKKHKKKLASTVTQVLIGDGDIIQEVELPFDQAWKIMNFPLLTLPRAIDPDKDFTGDEGVEVFGIETIHFDTEHLTRHLSSTTQFARILDRIDVISFVRLLAKIAHGYHVSIHGMFPRQESPLIPIILGQRLDAKNWIGGIDEHPLQSDSPALHLLAEDSLPADNGSQAVAVRLRLFAPQKAPTYIALSRLIAPAADARGAMSS